MSQNYYNDNASALFDRYQQLDPAAIHAGWLKHLPATPGLACDIGAGSGRDANWLAAQGWDVIAVEPARGLREMGQQHSHPNVTWLDDALPELSRLRTAGHRFNLILISAVWMHLPQSKRERAFRILSELLAPGGILVITLRHGSDKRESRERGFHPVSTEELNHFARQRAIAVLDVSRNNLDQMNRASVKWETITFQLPDDGTGNLPLLRHIIVNDDKAASYKLGLLRTLIRIAESASGMVIKRTDDTVTIPFGLVGLYWLKLYKPLVLQHNLLQTPTASHQERKGYGWAGEDFWKLDSFSNYDLRVGSIFAAEQASILIGAIRDACANIQKMPAHFITYPGQNRQVFTCERKSIRRQQNQHWRIDKETLSLFGEFTIPASLWQSMGQFACWLEPAIIREWAALMNRYDLQYDSSIFEKAFEWEEGRRDTSIARKQASRLQQELRQESQYLHCTWSAKRLQDKRFAIDHCFPWTRWLNNDLWNLMPATEQANNQKRDRLPSAPLMHESENRIKTWWQRAYLDSEFGERFMLEAETALPLVQGDKQDVEGIFEAMLHQRARLKANQQIAEWNLNAER